MGKRVPKRVLGEGTLGGRGPRPGWVGALATSDGKENGARLGLRSYEQERVRAALGSDGEFALR